jgi:hypothetical protein
MNYKEESQQSKERELVEAGIHTARCYQVIDLGRQRVFVQGQEKLQHKVFIGFELPEALMADGRPFSIGREFTLSLNEKSKLRAVLTSWLGFAKDCNEFDFKRLLGLTAFVNVTHYRSEAKETTYANLDSVMPLKKSVTCPDPVNTPVFYDMELNKDFDKVPKWLQDKINKSVDMAASSNTEDIPF